MKLVTYSQLRSPLKTSLGLLWGEWILDIHNLSRLSEQLSIPAPKRLLKISDIVSSILELLEHGPKTLQELQELSWRVFNRIEPIKISRTMLRVSDVKLHSPIPLPPLIRDFYAFEEHVKNARARRGLGMPEEWYQFPAFYYSNSSTVVGPDDDIPIPSYSKALDYELEIACVIGKSGRNISEKHAQDFIAGYTIMNDWSARDIQEKEMKIGLGPAKAKDFATSLGPWLVTADELEDKKAEAGRFDLTMTARVNGKPVSNGNMKSMHWSFSQMIARASESVELHPGEVFGSGTVGTGSIFELGPKVHPYLQPGDLVELEIERLGVLRNRIIQSVKPA
ncbi:MAG TPA: fumarylacetoacetate hydrolase family protein [Candidatus Bathyarchaeia archaeon]|nr:fumarylacetoacetate hydrolase family protein [Candidatus Bathyarchaeia archaeon]